MQLVTIGCKSAKIALKKRQFSQTRIIEKSFTSFLLEFHSEMAQKPYCNYIKYISEFV